MGTQFVWVGTIGFLVTLIILIVRAAQKKKLIVSLIMLAAFALCFVIGISMSVSEIKKHDEVNRIARENYVPVPDVFGVDHNVAKQLVEAAGYECSVIGVEPEAVLSSHPGYAEGQVYKTGVVIKINNNVYYYDEYFSPLAPNNKVILYYTVKDFVWIKVEEATTSKPAQMPEPEVAIETTAESPLPEKAPTDTPMYADFPSIPDLGAMNNIEPYHIDKSTEMTTYMYGIEAFEDGAGDGLVVAYNTALEKAGFVQIDNVDKSTSKILVYSNNRYSVVFAIDILNASLNVGIIKE